MNQRELLDPNLYKTITKCYINKRRPDRYEIFVIYADGTRESVWTYNPMRYDFEHHDFLGKSKIEAVFYCDRKDPRTLHAPL